MRFEFEVILNSVIDSAPLSFRTIDRVMFGLDCAKLDDF